MYYTLRSIHRRVSGVRPSELLRDLTGNTMLDIQLQAELLVFLDERDPSGQQSFIDGLEREVVLGVAQFARLYACMRRMITLPPFSEAQRLRQEEPHTSANRRWTTEAALNIWEALARIGRAQRGARP
jgi:hypothetical protein